MSFCDGWVGRWWWVGREFRLGSVVMDAIGIAYVVAGKEAGGLRRN